ncbi:hypothetical protein [Nesterenkonia sp. HG001]|uniref:hypothetical protein n=1 Tax=Nesterenkonia sp. HG001 TaxID=2983207 RepID=UPI002AC45914|nr:hypothetical protein [Nesterenkonia sp. HG001]MDZ5076241.1 dolichyl-diphosphooligosaccharide--protein glycosyltransferase subunit 2 [Nesterenkonia sp. HG001]
MPEKDSPRDSPQPDFNAPQGPRRFTQARPRPWPVWVIFLILLMQGLALGINTVASFVVSESAVLDTVGMIAMLVLYLLFGAILILLGFRIFMGAAGARTPAMVLQLLIVVLSFSFFAGGLWQVGLLFVVPAALAMLLAFVQPTRDWLDATS